jgi:hypothetical protein
LPIAHDDYIKIHDILINIRDHGDFFNDLRKIIDILDDFNNKSKDFREPCNTLSKGVRNVLNRLHDYMAADGYFKRAGEHALANVFHVIQRYENIRDYLRAKDWENYGAAQGELYRFIFFWDFS